jgi:hypothetical protein
MFDRATEQDALNKLDDILRLIAYPPPALQSALNGETPLDRYMNKMCQPL